MSQAFHDELDGKSVGCWKIHTLELAPDSTFIREFYAPSVSTAGKLRRIERLSACTKFKRDAYKKNLVFFLWPESQTPRPLLEIDFRTTL